MLRKFLIVIGVFIFAQSVFAEPLKRNSKTALCKKISSNVLSYSGQDLKNVQKICMKKINTEVSKKTTHKIGSSDFLTGLDAKFELSFSYNNEDMVVKGSSRLLYEQQTTNSGAIKGYWKVSNEHFTVDDKTVNFQTVKAAYVNALENWLFDELVELGVVREASPEEFNKASGKFDIYELIDAYQDPYDFPDYDIQNHEETFYVYDKDGVVWPFAVESSWEMASTEHDELDYSSSGEFWLVDSNSEFIDSLK